MENKIIYQFTPQLAERIFTENISKHKELKFRGHYLEDCSYEDGDIIIDNDGITWLKLGGYFLDILDGRSSFNEKNITYLDKPVV